MTVLLSCGSAPKPGAVAPKAHSSEPAPALSEPKRGLADLGLESECGGDDVDLTSILNRGECPAGGAPNPAPPGDSLRMFVSPAPLDLEPRTDGVATATIVNESDAAVAIDLMVHCKAALSFPASVMIGGESVRLRTRLNVGVVEIGAPLPPEPKDCQAAFRCPHRVIRVGIAAGGRARIRLEVAASPHAVDAVSCEPQTARAELEPGSYPFAIGIPLLGSAEAKAAGVLRVAGRT